MRRIAGSGNIALRCTTCRHIHLYMLYACMLYSRWAGNAIYWASAGLMVVYHVGQLYTYLHRWKFWTIVWENTNSVHFCVVWENTAHVQGITCSPKVSHLIPWTSAVFSNTALKLTPFAYRITGFIPTSVASYQYQGGSVFMHYSNIIVLFLDIIVLLMVLYPAIEYYIISTLSHE